MARLSARLAGLVLCLVLVGLALDWLHAVLVGTWPTLLLLAAVAVALGAGLGLLRQRDRW